MGIGGGPGGLAIEHADLGPQGLTQPADLLAAAVGLRQLPERQGVIGRVAQDLLEGDQRLVLAALLEQRAAQGPAAL